MGKNNSLTQNVNFIISVVFLGAFALFAIVLILEAAEEANPIADIMAARISEAEGL